jgi:hypothetical protein
VNQNGAATNYADRIRLDVAPLAPSIVFITSYFNDRGHPPQDIAAGFAAAIDNAQALPSRPIVIVTGMYDPGGVNGKPYTQVDPLVRLVCAQRGVAYVEPSTGVAYDAGGEAHSLGGPWITKANKDRFISPDGAHQSTDGQVYFADREYDAIIAISGRAKG